MERELNYSKVFWGGGREELVHVGVCVYMSQKKKNLVMQCHSAKKKKEKVDEIMIKSKQMAT